MNIPEFVRESNKIEGIHRDPTHAEIVVLDAFVQASEITVEDLQQFVTVNQPGAVLRDKARIPGVRVGDHIAPPSGPMVRQSLHNLLGMAMRGDAHPYVIHSEYETLHPFTDGNGRSGRAVWAWQMMKERRSLALGFLHTWYYQSLQQCR